MPNLTPTFQSEFAKDLVDNSINSGREIFILGDPLSQTVGKNTQAGNDNRNNETGMADIPRTGILGQKKDATLQA